MKKSSLHIAIAGNIGAGKSTLAERLADHFDWHVEYEVVDNNPYLEDYYQNMKRWAFHVQVCFLNSRFEQIKNIKESTKPIIQDRSIYEDAYVFAKSLFEQELLTERDYHNYQRLFHSMMEYIQPPDLIIYLRSNIDHLLSNIKTRNRSYEKEISRDYLSHLNDHYETWLSKYDLGPLLKIDVDQIDFVNNSEDLKSIITQVESLI